MKKNIVVENVSKTYFLFNRDYQIIKWLFRKKHSSGEKHVLKNISFTVNEGEVVGLIGCNGAGKSTLMKMVAGITFPTAGNITVNGRVGSLINLSAGFNKDYTGRKNIYYKGTLLGMTKEEIDSIIDDIIEFVELGEYFDMPLRTYSSGMAARLGFGLAVFSDPDILIVDEVFAVGDKRFQNKSREKTTQLFQAGKSILFSSHSDTLIRQFCNRVIYLRDGQIVYEGDVETGLSMYEDDVNKRGR
ncbi:MAG: ABC transporter ATP-binding protein [Clostridiales bacterium]|nr:ABC transporter ATP-binding protein [Clostridiales bacterium]